MTQYHALLAVASIMTVVGFACLATIFLRNQRTFEQLTLSEAWIDLLSHLPNTEVGPVFHVLGSVLIIAGLSLTASLAISQAVRSEDTISIVIALSGLFIAVSFSAVSMWTLWQTRRIDFKSGYKISDFYDLISSANREIESLLESYRKDYNSQHQPFHRVYLVTNQPLFGMVSYPQADETVKFKAHLRDLADCCCNPSPFDFSVLCGNHDAVERMHKEMMANTSLNDQEKAARAEFFTTTVDNEISQLNNKCPRPIFKRVPEVPPVQFMIIGNKLFEFTLDTSGPRSEIFNTQLITDSRYCEAYTRMFRILSN